MHDLALPSAGFGSGAADACLFGLSLCSGAGGLDLGLAIAIPGYRAVGHVERETYAAAILVARMEDAALDQARVEAGELVPTAPLPGGRFMQPPPGTPARALEDQALVDLGIGPNELAQAGRDLPGTRRPVVIPVTLGQPPIEDVGPDAVRLRFTLPAGGYATVLLIDVFIAALFAASLHAIVGPGGLHSFGHAAYFGLGAYGAALLTRAAGLPMGAALLLAPLVAAGGALLYGWFCVRLSGVSLTMLTLAFAQITWAIAFQWDGLTGGSNGLTGVWPPDWAQGTAFYWLVLAFVAAGLYLLRRLLFAPLGWALRAARDSATRAEAIGINVRGVQWAAFVVAGLLAGLAGALFTFSKGGVAPEVLWVGKSVDGLVMVLLGGMQQLAGPLVGAAAFTWLHDSVARATDYWRALLGGIMLVLVLLFPQGISGFAHYWQALIAPKKGVIA